MRTVVVPFAGAAGKTRLAAARRTRQEVSLAMLGDVLAAALALAGDGPALVVNADLPCVTADDLEALTDAIPAHGLALVEAADGTTNALGLSSPSVFAPVYGPGSADRFRGLTAGSVTVSVPNLVDDVDTLADLERLFARCGPRTQACLATT